MNNRKLYNNNRENTKVRANTFGLSSYTHQNINNKNTSNNNSKNNFKSYDDLAVAESTQINRLNSNSDYISQSKQNTVSSEGVQFESDIQSPRSSNSSKKHDYYCVKNDKQYYKNNISILNSNKTNLITHPKKDLPTNNINNNWQTHNTGTQRKRLNSALVSGRFPFPTPLEKLKFGKRKPITSNSPKTVQCLKRRNVTSQINSPNKFTNDKSTRNNNSVGKTEYPSG